MTENYPNFLLTLFFVGTLLFLLSSRNSYEKMQNFKATAGRAWQTALLLIWCIFSFSGISTFLYFNF